MAKNIIFCADGTWNNPGQDENDDSIPDPTNVYKLFIWLAGAVTAATLRAADEQEKWLVTGATIEQVAKYIHGVGDSRNPINKIFGGTFGAGVIARIARGYTFISRHYEKNANIYITGFSRGAYTARALAGMIASQGVLRKELTEDKELAYRRAAQVWYRYRSAAHTKTSILAHFAEVTANLPAFISQKSIKKSDLVAVDRIAAVAVWDTVGAMGFPLRVGREENNDAFQFTNLDLSPKVGMGFHAVALDEQRTNFEPTLWNDATNVKQLLFPGAHSDVGGGYPTANHESELSDIALQWMQQELSQAGARFDAPSMEIPFKQDAGGVAHKPWKHPPWNIAPKATAPRVFGAHIQEHAAIGLRYQLPGVVSEPGEARKPYRPTNRP
jgi:uncharacterized protein (DUF2235 family)